MQTGFSDFPFRQVRLISLLTDLSTGHAAKAGRRPVARDPFINYHQDVPVALLRMRHFHPENDELNWGAISNDLIQTNEPPASDMVERRLIIEPDDLLLNLRGQPRVIRIGGDSLDAMPQPLAAMGLRLAPTNNFILIRPQKQLVHVPFLHLLLQLMLEEFMEGWNAVTQKRDVDSSIRELLEHKYREWVGSSKSPGLPIGARELRDLMISIPDQMEDQEKLYQDYQNIRTREMLIKTELLSFRKSLSQFTNPNLFP